MRKRMTRRDRATFRRAARYGLIATALTALLLWVFLVALIPVLEAADPDQPIVLAEAHGFQCLQTTSAATTADCDMLVLVRYELPKADWRAVDGGGDPKYMEEVTCADDDENNFIDLCYTSLLPGMATLGFYSGPHTTAQLEAVESLPRVGHGVSATYLAAGHGLTFGDTTYEACIEPSLTIFTPATPVCSVLTWNTVTDADGDGEVFDDAQTTNAAALQTIAANLDAATPGLNDLITINSLIGPVGGRFLGEAYGGWNVAAPAAFAVRSERVDSVTLSLTPTAAETAIEAESAASPFYGYLTDFAANRMNGAPVGIIAGVVGGFAVLLVFTIVMLILRTVFVATAAALVMLFAVALQDLIDINLIYTVILLIGGLGIFVFARRIFA